MNLGKWNTTQSIASFSWLPPNSCSSYMKNTFPKSLILTLKLKSWSLFKILHTRNAEGIAATTFQKQSSCSAFQLWDQTGYALSHTPAGQQRSSYWSRHDHSRRCAAALRLTIRSLPLAKRKKTHLTLSSETRDVWQSPSLYILYFIWWQ